jgi:cytochrome c553
MKLIEAGLAIFVSFASSVASSAGEVGFASYGAHFANRNCTWCHGPSLQGFSTAPRLAGQKQQYLETQLLDFKAHTRDNPFSRQYMWGAAANHLSLETVHDLVVYLSTLDAASAHDGDRALAASGQALYREGIPAANIPSCVACHGPNAEGFGGIPRLGGLSYYYLKQRLEQWGEGYHAAATPPMPEVASKLSKNDIEALASYLSFVR